MIPLKPLKLDDKIKKIKFSTFDIESTNWIEYVCSAAAWRDSKGNLKGRNFDSIEEYLDFVFSKEHPCNIVYMHGGSIFDFDFLLDAVFENKTKYFLSDNIQRSSGFLLFSLSLIEPLSEPKHKCVYIDGKPYKKVRTIEFRDSSALLIGSLAGLSKEFNVEHKKIENVDRGSIVEATDKVKEYNLYDCYALLEVIEHFSNWDLISKVGISTTTASQALRVFRTFLKEEIPSLTLIQDEFIRKGYFGGRTEIFKSSFKSKRKNDRLYYYDFNSLYPSCMLGDMPVFLKDKKIKNESDIKNEIGFLDCEVEVPNMYVPPLPTICEIDGTNKLVFPVGKIRGVFSTAELAYSLKFGVKVLKYYDSYVFKKGDAIFKDYILKLYNMRKAAGSGTITGYICKILMNSLYGRFGLNKNRKELVFNPSVTLGMRHHSTVNTTWGKVEFYERDKYLDKSYTNVAIAAWITSLARIKLHEVLHENREHIYYCDTDSVFLSKSLGEGSFELGKLKKELDAKAAYFILPKSYCLDGTSNPKKKKIVALKGFSKSLVQGFEIKDFENHLKGIKRLSIGASQTKAKLRSALRHGAFLFLRQEQGRVIRSLYDKRVYISRNGNMDTRPLYVRDNKIDYYETMKIKTVYIHPSKKNIFNSLAEDIFKDEMKKKYNKGLV